MTVEKLAFGWRFLIYSSHGVDFEKWLDPDPAAHVARTWQQKHVPVADHRALTQKQRARAKCRVTVTHKAQSLGMYISFLPGVPQKPWSK